MANHRRGEWSDVPARFGRMGVAIGVAIHHTAGLPAMLRFDPAQLRSIERGQINSGAYSSLAYHTMFSLDGDSAEARPYGATSAATGGHNHHTIAFCVPGFFHAPHLHQPTDALLAAMAQEIRDLIGLGFLAPDPIIEPHTWWTAGTRWATSCCGSELIPKVATVRDWVRNAPAGGGASPTPRGKSMATIIQVGNEEWLYEYPVFSGFTPEQRAAYVAAGIPVIPVSMEFANQLRYASEAEARNRDLATRVDELHVKLDEVLAGRRGG